LMVSGNELRFVAAAIRCYLAQTYAHKELVIVRDPARPVQEVAAHVDSLGRKDIRFVVASGSPTLAELRNVSVESADGEVLCQWDDDDLSHPQRIAVQLEAMRLQDARACYLQATFDHYVEARELYWADWSRALHRCHAGTAMWRKSKKRYSSNPEFAFRGEDRVFFFGMKPPVAGVAGAPFLYVYSFHGRNTYDEARRRELLDFIMLSSRGREEEFANELAKMGLSVYPKPRGDSVVLGVA